MLKMGKLSNLKIRALYQLNLISLIGSKENLIWFEPKVYGLKFLSFVRTQTLLDSKQNPMEWNFHRWFEPKPYLVWTKTLWSQLYIIHYSWFEPNSLGLNEHVSYIRLFSIYDKDRPKSTILLKFNEKQVFWTLLW